MAPPPDAERTLRPGAAHPHPPSDPATIAAWLGVPTSRVLAWCGQGLPADASGAIDPFSAVNWIADHDLAGAPALRARWRRFLRWFQPFVLGADRTCARQVMRRHRLFLPHPAGSVRWWLPRLESASGTPVETGLIEEGPTVGLTTTVLCVPHHHPLPELVPLVEDLVAGCRYGYRHHRPMDAPPPPHGWWSCLDLAEELGRRVSELGMPWRLRSGVVASTTLSNPHFWIEVRPGRSWIPIDPSLPAIARQYGHHLPGCPDWRIWAQAYTGGCDARRVAMAPMAPPDLPWSSHGGVAGEVTADGVNAWACADWVCGECRWEFSAAMLSAALPPPRPHPGRHPTDGDR